MQQERSVVARRFISNIFFFTVIFLVQICCPDQVKLSVSGQYTQELYFADSLYTLNSKIVIDDIWYIRTTLDVNIDGSWGNRDNQRIHFFDTVRSRFIWGMPSDARLFSLLLALPNGNVSIPGSTTNKTMVWTKEGWLKCFFDLLCEKDFIQIGLIPYEIGRGISLGSAYDVSGYLGFQADFSIDQFAPGIVVHYTPVKDKYSTDFYLALLKNQQNSFDEIMTKVRTSPTKKDQIRGIGTQTYVAVWDHKIKDVFSDKISLEPYILFCHAPNQTIQRPNDSSVNLTTLGMAIEGEAKRCNWGVEFAGNLGELCLKFWDHNTIEYIKNDAANIVAQFSKIYNQDPRTEGAQLVDATQVNINYVKGSTQSVAMNGKQIGPGLYNAYDRFTPAQQRNMQGFFFLGDIEYSVIPEEFTVALGTGYASGTDFFHEDMNEMDHDYLMNQAIGGFVPLQSEYVGKRIRHVVMFHQGVPRYSEVKLVNPATNVIQDIEDRTVQGVTNIAFLGMRLGWNVPKYKQHKLIASFNTIAYWSPVVHDEYHLETKKWYTPSNFMGTEISGEVTGMIFDKIKMQGYCGVLIPGQYYKDNRGMYVSANKLPTGSDPGWVGGLIATYSF